jgi:hypothetical protein
MRADDFADANRLLRFSVDRSSRPGADPAHRALLERFRTDPGYASAVRFAAEPLGLRVLGADPQVGLILDPAADSPFALRSDDLIRDFKWTSAAERITFGVAFVGIATYCYPTANSFGESGARRVTAVEVDDWIRKAATAAQADSTAGGEEIAVADALAVYVAEKSISRNKDSSALRQDCTVYRVGRVLAWLAKQQFMVRDATKQDVYRSTERFRLHVREVAAKTIFDAVRAAAMEGED